MVEYVLPRDTQEAFRVGQAGCRNLGLLFDRYTPFGEVWALEGRHKYEAFKSLVEAVERARRDRNYQQFIQQYHRRWREAAKAAGASDDCIFTAGPEWRFVAGLGRESVLETGFAFHRVYGFPYVPGSALKGLTQAYALWQVAGRLEVPSQPPGQKHTGKTPIQQLEALLMEEDPEERKQGLQQLRADESGVVPPRARIRTTELDELLGDLSKDASRYQAVFGSVRGRGRVIFFDSVPMDPPTLAVDVMNPHYSLYYQGQSPPADYLSPVPVYFLTVQAGSRFVFAVATRPTSSGDQESTEKARILARQARDWLRAALTEMGAGGKTSAGYGYWVVFQEML